MSSSTFFARQRLKAARAAVRSNRAFNHTGSQTEEIKGFFRDLAHNLADQRKAEEKDAFAYVLRVMAALAEEHAELIYEPYGYENIFYNKVETYRDLKKIEWKYPVINQPPSSGWGLGDVEFRKYSALKMFGYTVGTVNGWGQPKRRAFLSDFMEMNLPKIVSDTFGDEYGAPLSATRLRKIANVIAMNAKNFYRNDPSRYAVAISEWESDLLFLKDEYYEKRGLKFQPWPITRLNL